MIIVYGICYEHDIYFIHLSDIAAEVDEGEKHVPKENMVIAVSSNSKILKVK